MLLAAALPARPQPAAGAERTVEMVFADSEHQARVVGRAMQTGFLIDQLLIPDTTYYGRIPWSELNPSLRSVLETAAPLGARKTTQSRPLIPEFARRPLPAPSETLPM